eukprot:g19523.t1
MANVSHLFKKGGRQKTGLVSLTSVIGKILVSIIKNENVEYLEVQAKIGGIVAKFADDTKKDEGTGSVEELEKLQKELDRLGEWATKWQMEYNVESTSLRIL